MTTARTDLRPHSLSLALEQRLLFDGAGAVAFVDAFDDPSADRTTQEDVSFKPFDGDIVADKRFTLEGDPKTKEVVDGVETWVDAEVTLEITVTGGTATMDGATVSGNTLTMSGTLDQLNTALKTLEFTPADDQNSSVDGYESSLKFVASYQDGEGNTLEVDETVNLAVSAVNDAPDLSTGKPLELQEGDQSQVITLDQLAIDKETLDVDIKTGQQLIEQMVIKIDGLPQKGELRFDGGVVRPGMVIAVSDVIAGKLTYSHNGEDVVVDDNDSDSFAITVYDGGGGATEGTIEFSIAPKNAPPSVVGAPWMYEGAAQNVAPTIELGDASDTLEGATITLTSLQSNGQGRFFINRGGVREYLPDGDYGNISAADLALLSFEHNGEEPDAPGMVAPSYSITVTDSGGGEGSDKAETVTETVEISVLPNNDDPVLAANNGASVGPTGSVVIGSGQLQVTDQDRDPADRTKTTPANQLVYTVESVPAYGNLQLRVGGVWVTLDRDSRFTQDDIDQGRVQYVQTVFTDAAGNPLTDDTFDFSVRDSAFGLDVSDPANTVPGYEGGVRTEGGTPVYAGGPTRETFQLTLVEEPDLEWENTDPEGDPDPNPGTVVPPAEPPGNDGIAPPWYEDNLNPTSGGGYLLTDAMLKYEITYPVQGGDVKAVSAAETVYTLMGEPGNGRLERQTEGGGWETIANNSQFTQDDINAGRIRFIHDGSENHKSSFGFRVSDGTAASLDGEFEIKVIPINDSPVAGGGVTEVLEGDGKTVALTDQHLRMSDVDGSHANSDGSQPHGEKDGLWFKVDVNPEHGHLERWNGSTWVTVGVGEWLPQALLTTAVDDGTEDGAVSGLRYVHDGTEPTDGTFYPDGAKVDLYYTVRDDLPAGSAFDAPRTDAVPDPGELDGAGHLSSSIATTINIIPVNDAPVIPDRPGLGQPADTHGVNNILTGAKEGGVTTITNSVLQAVDRDNGEVQRQFRITVAPELGVLMRDGKVLGVGSTFTQKDIDDGLIEYKNNGNELGALKDLDGSAYHDKFHFVVSDGALTDSGDDASNNAFLIQLAPTNDLPAITAPLAGKDYALGTPGTPTLIDGWKLADRDLGTDLERVTVEGEEDFLRVEIEASHPDVRISFDGGMLVDADLTGSRAYVNGLNTSKVVLQGTASEIQDALDKLQTAFVGSGNHDVTLTVTVDDRLYTSAGLLDPSGGTNGGTVNQDGSPINDDNNQASASITLHVSNSNEAPAITNSNPSYTVNEDTAVTLGGFTLNDADSFDLPVKVVVSLYTDAARTTPVDPSEHGGLISGASRVSSLELTGTMAQVQAQLNALQYQGAEDFNNGPVYLRVEFTDHGHADFPDGRTATLDRDITVVPVNDAPVLTVDEDRFVMDSSAGVAVPGISINDDRDVGQGAADNFTVTITGTLDDVLTVTAIGAGVTGSGTNALTLTGSKADINAALATLHYNNGSSSNADTARTLTIVVDDHGNGQEGVGTSSNNTATDTIEIFVSGVNDPARVTGNDVTRSEGSATISLGSGTTNFHVDDPDDDGGTMTATVTVPEGFLITAVGGAGGTVEGLTSRSITITGTEAQINSRINAITVQFPGATTTERQDWNGSFDVTVVVNDGGNTGVRPADLDGDPGTDDDDDTDNPREGYGDFEYADPDPDSTDNALVTTRIVTITITNVNDAPTRVGGENVSFGNVVEDSGTGNLGKTVNELFGGKFSDAKDNQYDVTANPDGSQANGFAGIAITGNLATAAQGVWEYSTDNGATWTAIPAVSAGNAFFVGESDQIRFSPVNNFHGTPGGLNARLVETSSTTRNTGDRFSVASSGGTTPISNSGNVVRLTTVVTPVNDAPTVSGEASLGGLVEDVTADDAVSAALTAGELLEQLTYSDNTDDRTGAALGSGETTATPAEALAITGNAADAEHGKWQYTLDGSTWSDVPVGVDNASAIVLDVANNDHKVRFVPNANFNGEPGTLTVRVADGEWNEATGVQDLTGQIGGVHAWSASTGTVAITVAPRNDAPEIEGATAVDPNVTEATGVTGSDAPSLGPVSLLTGDIIVNDLDLDSTDGLDGSVFGAGRVEVVFTNGREGDRFFIPESMDGVVHVTEGAVSDGESTDLIITFSESATLAQVQAVLAALQYSHTGDNPTDFGGRTSIGYTVTLYDGNNAQTGADDVERHAGGPNELNATPITGTITITADNDPPVAVADTNTVGKGTTTPIGGDVRANDSDPDNAREELVVTEVTITKDGVETTIPVGPGSPGYDADKGTSIEGEYGTLWIQEDGSYTYELDNDNPDVYGLQTDDTLTESFGYTIQDPGGVADPDDEGASSTLTITVTGSTTPPSITPVDKTPGDAALDPELAGDNRVYESGLGDAADNSETTTGEINVSSPDGLVSVTIGGAGGITLTAEQLKDLSSVDAADLVFDTGVGTLTITGFTNTDTDGDADYPRSGTLAYSYTLNDSQDHPEGELPADALFDNIDLSVVSRGTGNDSTGTLSIQIVDDAPTAEDDARSIDEDSDPISGNVLTGTTNGDVADREGADGATVTSVKADTAAGSDIVLNDSSTDWDATKGMPVEGEYGTLWIKEDGSYTYELNTDDPRVYGLQDTQTLSDVFTYTLTDGDGDADTAALTITINGQTGAPAVTPNDENEPVGGGGVGSLDGHNTVSEKGLLADASGADVGSHLTEGGISIDVPDGMTSITITGKDGDVVITAEQLNEIEAGTRQPIEIETAEGLLRITGITITSGDPSAPREATVTYEYELESARSHGADEDRSEDSIALTVTDQNSETATGSLIIEILDDAPTAEDDARSIDEDSDPINGNVLTGTTDGDVADREGADGATVTSVKADTAAGSDVDVDDTAADYDAAKGMPVEGEYGTLWIKGDGSYTYELNTDDPRVYGLQDGQDLTDQFSYTLTDGDGDADTATLTITINGKTEAPSITPNDETLNDPDDPLTVGDNLVYESGLGDDTDHGETTTGTINVSSPDGLVSVTIGGAGGITLTVAQLQDLSLVDAADLVFDTGVGTLTVTGFTNTDTDGDADYPRSGTIAYSYALNAEQDHPAGALPADALFDNIDLGVVSRGTNNDNTGVLSIQIVDDAPTAEDDARSIDKDSGSFTGNVLIGTTDGDVADREGADGAVVTSVTPVGEAEVDVDDTATDYDAAKGMPVEGEYGTLWIKGDGSYTYELNTDDPRVYGLQDGQDLTDQFTYTLTDGDGDADTAALTITIEGKTEAPTITPVDQTPGDATLDPELAGDNRVYESGLGDAADNSETATGTINVSSPDGLVSVTIGGAGGITLTAEQLKDLSSVDAADLVFETGVGTLTVTGFTNTDTNGDADYPRSGTIAYSYTLNAEQDHPEGELPADALFDNIDLSVVSRGTGNDSTGTLSIQIVDDAPTAEDDARSIDKDSGSFTGNVLIGTTDGDVADREGADGAVVTSVTPVGEAEVDVDDAATDYDAAKGMKVEGEYGALWIKEDGSYTYELDTDDPRVYGLQDGQDLADQFTYTLTDGDGDTDGAALTITINGKDGADPVITPIDGNGEVGGDPAANGHNTVDEVDLRNGGTATTDGTITLTVPDGLLTVTIGDQTLTVDQLKALSASSRVTITTAAGTLTLTGFTPSEDNSAPRAGTIHYTYTLSGPVDQPGQAESTDEFVLEIVDQGNKSSAGNLVIQIVDDMPTAQPDENAVTEDVNSATSPVGGNVLADGSTDDVADEQGADGVTVTEVAAGPTVTGTPGKVGEGVPGAYGTLTLNADGSYSYALDNANTDVMALNAGDTLTETFSYTITDADGDESTTTLTITINGANNPPEANTDTGTIEKGTVSVPGNIRDNDTDPDNPTTDLVVTEIVPNGGTPVPVDPDPSVPTPIQGEYGTLTIHPDGSYTYTPNNDDPRVYGLQDGDPPLTENFGYTIQDPDGSTDSSTLTITITGKSGDIPTITPVDGNGDVGGDPAANGQNTVDEVDLRNGGTATVDGTISLNVPDGILTVTVGGETLTIDQLKNLGTEPVTIVTADGTLLLTGFTPSEDNSAPRAGTIDYTYTLNGPVNQSGVAESSDTFGLNVVDQGNKSSDGTLVIQILDDTPTAQPDENAVTEDVSNATSPVSGNVLESGSSGDVSDEQGADGVMVTEVAFGAVTGTVGVGLSGAYGTLTLNADGSYSYALDNSNTDVMALNVGDTLTETFSYTITDADGDESTTTLTITINGANNPPEANTDTGTVEKGTPSVPGNIRDNDTDPDNPTTDLVVTEIVPNGGTPVPVDPDPSVPTPIQGEYGTLTIHPDGSYTYTPNNDDPRVYGLQDGDPPLEENFGYTIQDPDGSTDGSTLTITITGKNGEPPAIAPIDGNGDGVIGEATVHEKGLVDGDGSEKTTGTIDLSVADGLKSVTIGGTTLTVEQLQNLGNTPVTIDTGEGILVLTGFTGEANGAPRTGTISYEYTLKDSINQPNAQDSTDVIPITVLDQGNKSGTGNLTIQIVDDKPLAENDANRVTEGQPTTSGNVVGEGRSGDVADRKGADGATVTDVAFGGASGEVGKSLPGSFGTLMLNPDGSYTYALDNTNPAVIALNVGYTLTETFSYTITDADGDASTATLTITIDGINTPPEAVEDSATVEKGTPSIPGSVRDNDTDPDHPIDDLVVTEIIPNGGTPVPVNPDPSVPTVIPGKYGELTIHPDGSYTYVPNQDDPRVYGLQENDPPLKEEFGYTIKDPSGSTDDSTLTITITGKNGAPPVLTPVDGNGSVEGEATVQEKGLTDPNDPSESASGTITVTVPDGMTTLTVEGKTFTVDELRALTPEHPSAPIDTGEGIIVITGITVPDSEDPSAPREATIHYTYTLKAPIDQPNADSSTDVITLTATDQGGKTGGGSLTIQIVDDLPQAEDDTGTISSRGTSMNGNVISGSGDDKLGADGPIAGGPVTSVANGSGTPGTVGNGLSGQYGTLTLNPDGSYTYDLDRTNPDVLGLPLGDTLTETYTYTITDADGDTSTATLTITIQGDNAPPVATNDGVFKGLPGLPLNNIPVLGNDSDPDGDPLTVVSASVPPGQGTVTINPDGTLNYVPALNVLGEVVITYTITDGYGGTSTAVVVIEVEAIPAPVPPAPPTRPTDPGRIPGSGGPLDPQRNLVTGDQVRDHSVWFYGDTWLRVSRMPVPFHPVVYVNQEVRSAQQQREATDHAGRSDPSYFPIDDSRLTSRNTGLGMDPNLFVQHMVRLSQSHGDWLNALVAGRLGRTSLSSDNFLPAPDLGLPPPPMEAQRAAERLQQQREALRQQQQDARQTLQNQREELERRLQQQREQQQRAQEQQKEQAQQRYLEQLSEQERQRFLEQRRQEQQQPEAAPSIPQEPAAGLPLDRYNAPTLGWSAPSFSDQLQQAQAGNAQDELHLPEEVTG